MTKNQRIYALEKQMAELIGQIEQMRKEIAALHIYKVPTGKQVWPRQDTSVPQLVPPFTFTCMVKP